ncbi:MAG: 23S rRNA (pseudouridine(1915)-N(3))-methyltransferase RlmH [Clostridia bacterium]|nr:23S rRNA (pseudouridine(1915)-N(3))-methyltransferase RlmH [Clostridia bacterium]
MLKVKIIAVGKIKEKYFIDAISEYSKRLSRYANFSIVEVKEENFVKEPNESEILEILKREGVGVSKEISGYTVACCIEGKKQSSKGLASLIKEVKNISGEMCFIIGGSYGLDESVKSKADAKISVSDMTFPHTLFRVLLVEQIYRAFSILNDGKYHK